MPDFVILAFYQQIELGIYEGKLWIFDMKLPVVQRVGINKGQGITGSYLDGEYVFHIIEEGPWSFEVSDKVFQADKMNLVLLPPHHLHAVTPIGQAGSDHWVVHFQLPAGDLSLKSLPWLVRVDGSARRECVAGFQELSRIGDAADPCPWLQASHLLKMLSIYRRAAIEPLPPSRKEGQLWLKIEKAIGIIQEQHAYSDLAIADISETCQLSHAYFCRQFKAVVGKTPYVYLTQFRVDRASDLLLNSDCSCQEIAMRTGFADSFTFSKVFRSFKGAPPLRWRKRYLRDERNLDAAARSQGGG